MSFLVNLYQTKNRVNDLNKELTPLKTNIELNATGSISPDELDIIIDYDVFDLKSNYAHIPIFGRYYFLKYQINGNFVTCHLKSDPLISFKDDVLNADIIAERSSSNFEKYLPDQYVKDLNHAQIAIARFKNVFTTGENGTHYILRVGGR